MKSIGFLSFYVSQTLAGEAVAIEETEEGEWALRFYNHPIGIIDRKHLKLSRRTPPNCNQSIRFKM